LVLRHWASVSPMTIYRNQLRSSWNIFGKSSPVHITLQSHQSLANLVVGSRVDLPTLGIAKEVVQSIITALSAVECGVLPEIATVLYWIVDGTIGRWLLRSIVSVVAILLRVAIVWLAGVHLGAMIVVACCSGCKILQVSDHFSTLTIAGSLTVMLFGRPEEDRVVGVGLYMLLQVLGTLEGLSTEITFVRLQWDVDSDVGGDMIALDRGGTA